MSDSIVNELRENFAARITGFRQIRNLSDVASAWSVIDAGRFGVAIPNPNNVLIRENFANAQIESASYIFGDETMDILLLMCSQYSLRTEFASICVQFVELGLNGSNRHSIQADPFIWWRRWRELMGNRIGEKKAFSVIGEMLAVDSQLDLGETVTWGGPQAGTHDIETGATSIEVKSTLQKYSAEVIISSHNQLASNKPIWLYFVRLEESGYEGVSIGSMSARLVAKGYDRVLLEGQLFGLGFGEGTDGRGLKYQILEKRKYEIDEDFPRITNDSFRDGHIPTSITRIEYTVNLEGIRYYVW